MDYKIERRLTAKEKRIIDEIEKKALKRKHIPKYTSRWIIDYMLETFKDFDYDEKADAIDMLDAIFEIASECGFMTGKQIKKERKYMMKEYVDGQFEDEDDKHGRRN